MKWLVTGGCGFIGTNFIHYILQNYKDIDILNVDNLTYAGNLMNVKSIENDKRYSFVKGDIANEELMSTLIMKEIDLVINFAAESHVDKSIEGGKVFIKTNIQGTHSLLECCRKFDTRFIQISTDEVYGSIKEGSFRENDKLNPSSLYSSSKASAELLVLAYKKTYNLNTNIIRSSNNFGPYQFPEKLIPRFITNLLRGEKVPVYGTGKNIREWIYTEDNCRAIITVIEKGIKGEIYNIGSGYEKTNLEITRLILSKLSFGEEKIDYIKDRLGHDFRYAIDSSKIKELGWRPQYSFNKAFDKTIKWYLENQSWWKPLLRN